ncbi:MAG: DUF4893 domain-containing protein [Alphaproteobacteria bacterium]|nr:DUF4893 domain-containing protein [Alphaproteobacteria bacterium]MDE1987765.1 DUF4893 domain-containing protein [Alphaproteobacteria bacterium]MDE2264820.1 DUF4893 domain-containing protein [Alphaproteobacteria bacterium]MDE2500101.1 DUF4893 domain-containing protein [Alphaproteobacteria bacterium]
MDRKLPFAILALLLTATAANAGWRDVASQYDQTRFAKLAESRAAGLAQASQPGGTGDASAIHETLDPAAVSATAGEMEGNWRCRLIKLGGMTPYVVYSWFNCRIADQGGQLTFAKLSGSQHAFGTLYPEGGGFVYLGATTMKGEPTRHYSGDGASVGAPATPDDQIGLLSLIGPGHARLELPYPVQESTFDVVELKR